MRHNHSIPVVVTEESNYQRTTPDQIARHVGVDPKKEQNEFDRVGTKLAKDFDKVED
jgi:hypothetical protein